MKYKNLTLDEFQIQAIEAIENNHSVVVSAPTGSGKTLIADYIINKDLHKGIRVIYTAPIKALSNQKYKDFCKEFGKEKIGLLTGDIVKNQSAPILIMTTEIYRNMALSKDRIMDNISYVIFDEIHYINDIERGYVWEESIIFSKSNVRFLCLSATIPNAMEFASWIESIKKHKVEVIVHNEREVPLEKRFFDSELGITTLEGIREVAGIPDYNYIMGRRRFRSPRLKAPSHIALIKEIKENLPCLFFNFSRKKCQDSAFELMKANLFETNPEISSFVRKKLENSVKEIKELESSRLLMRTLPYGIAFHHAGLMPIIKELVEELFATSSAHDDQNQFHVHTCSKCSTSSTNTIAPPTRTSIGSAPKLISVSTIRRACPASESSPNSAAFGVRWSTGRTTPEGRRDHRPPASAPRAPRAGPR